MPFKTFQNVWFQVIYVARNPKDVIVSYYHFHNMAKFLKDPDTFSEFLTDFLEGRGLQTLYVFNYKLIKKKSSLD